MFIEHVVNRTLSRKSETPKSEIIPDLSPNFGLYNSKINQLTNNPNENQEQYVESSPEQPDLVPSKKTEKPSQLETTKIKNNTKSITDDNESPENIKEDKINHLVKKTTRFSNLKKPIEEKSQEKNIVIDKPSILSPSIPPKKVINPQIKSQKKEIPLENSVLTNTKKHAEPQTNIKMNLESKKPTTALTNDQTDIVNTLEKNSFVTNLNKITKTEDIITKNTININENKINNVKLDVTKPTENIDNSNISQIKSKNETKKNIDMQESPIQIEPYNKESPVINTHISPYEDVQKNNSNIVTINIDKIEVRANLPQQTKNNNSTPKSNRMSLSEYLQLRKEGAL